MFEVGKIYTNAFDQRHEILEIKEDYMVALNREANRKELYTLLGNFLDFAKYESEYIPFPDYDFTFDEELKLRKPELPEN